MKLHQYTSILSAVFAFSMIASGSTQFQQIQNNNAFTKPPLVFHNWPPKSVQQPQQQLQQQSLHQNTHPQHQLLQQAQSHQKVVMKPAPLRTIMLQIRSNTNPSGQLLGMPPTRLMMHRPIKASIPPRMVLKSAPIILKRPFLHQMNKQHQPYKFESPSGPIRNNDYVFEKIKNPIRFEPSVRLPVEGPIHTIPAPNLNPNNDKLQTSPDVSRPIDNNLDFGGFKSNSPISSAPITHPAAVQRIPNKRPSLHQYQVTEQTNDVTIKDSVSGKQTYFAPDPDPALPSQRVKTASDPLSTPTNGKVLPPDVYNQLVQTHPQFQESASAAALVQRPYETDSVPQYTVTDTYGIPLQTKPQLQQHILQQTNMLQGMPQSAYNPTYLVTQSNNLFNHHQQQLFKPVDSNYIGTLTPGHLVFGSYTFNNQNRNQESVASPGQLYAATQNQLNELQTAVSQLQFRDAGNSLTNSNGYHESESHDQPNYAPLVDNNNLNYNSNHQQNQQQPISEDEISSLLNYGSLNLQGQFIPSNNQQQSNDPYTELKKRQQENERILQQANQDLYKINMNEQADAHEQHRLAVEQQLRGDSNSNALRIFVPDSDEHNNYAQSRSDNFYVDDDYYDNNEELQDDAESKATETETSASDDSNENQE